MKVLVKDSSPSVTVKVLSLPVPPLSLMVTSERVFFDVEAKPLTTMLLMPRSVAALAMSPASPEIAPSPATETV